MDISELLSDEAILTELGQRIARTRIEQRLTQAEAAVQAGISKRTLERIESGASTQLSSFIRILRVLGLLARLEQLLPETGPSPMELLRHKGKERKRASSRGRAEQAEASWTWDDES